MTFVDIIIQFVTVFLGAFLAFWLENVRERQQLRGWLKKYLRDSYVELAATVENLPPFVSQLEAELARFSELSEGKRDPTEEDWKHIGGIVTAQFSGAQFLFESEALNVLTGDVIRHLKLLQDATDSAKVTFNQFHSIQEAYVYPLAIERPESLSAAQRRSLGLAGNAFERFVTEIKALIQQAPEVLAVLKAHGYHR